MFVWWCKDLPRNSVGHRYALGTFTKLIALENGPSEEYKD